MARRSRADELPVPQLSRERVKRYKEVFRVFDRDGDGRIAATEVGTAMKLLGRNFTEAQVQQMLGQAGVGSEPGETLDLATFLALAARLNYQVQRHEVSQLRPDQMAKFRDMFLLFDGDSDGSITARELVTAMRLLGETVTEPEAQALINSEDVDGNGRLDFTEFLHLMARHLHRDAVAGPRPQQVARYREVFAAFDRDGDGRITATELGTSLRLLGHNLTEAEVQASIDSADSNGNGTLEFDEFLDFMTRKQVAAAVTPKIRTPDMSREQLLEWRQKFNLFDRDGDGRITQQELGTVLRLLGENVTQAEVQAMINAGDLDGNGTLDFSEFLHLMLSHKA